MFRNVPRCSMFLVLSTPVFFGVLSLLSFQKQNRSCLVHKLMLEKRSFLPGTYSVESTPWRWLRRFCRVDLYFITTHTLEMDGTGLIL